MAWVEQAVRGQARIGWVIPEDADYDWTEFRRSKVEAAIAPTRLIEGEADVTLFLFPPNTSRATRRKTLEDRGFLDVRTPEANVLALGARPRDAAESGTEWRLQDAQGLGPGPVHREGSPWRLVLLVGLLVGSILSAGRHAWGAAGWMAVLAALSLALVAALQDALGGGDAVFLLMWLPALAWSHGWAVRLSPPPGPRSEESRLAACLMWLALAAGVALFLLRFGYEPEGMLDAQVMFNLRAHWILTEPSFWAPFVEPTSWPQQHLDYPPFLSFAVVGAWRVLGSDAPLGVAVVQLCLWLGSAVVAVSVVRRRSPWAAAALMGLLVASPFAARVAAWQVADGPLAAWLVVAFVAWEMADRDDRTWRGSHAFMAGVSLGVAAWTKNEGLAVALLVFVGCAGVLLRRRDESRTRFLTAAVPLGAALVGLWIFKSRVAANDLMALAGPQHISLERLGHAIPRWVAATSGPWPFRGVILAAVLMALPRRLRRAPAGAVCVWAWIQLGITGSWSWALVALAMGAVATFVGEASDLERTGIRRCAIVLLSVLVMYAGVYLMTPYDMSWQMDTSLYRVVAHVHGVAAVVLMLALSGVKPTRTNEPDREPIVLSPPVSSVESR